MIRFPCTKCGEFLEAPEELRGRTVQCPNCQLHERVPVPLAQRAAGSAAIKITDAIVRAWNKSPAPFRNALLATLGVLTGLLLGAIVYRYVILRILFDI